MAHITIAQVDRLMDRLQILKTMVTMRDAPTRVSVNLRQDGQDDSGKGFTCAGPALTSFIEDRLQDVLKELENDFGVTVEGNTVNPESAEPKEEKKKMSIGSLIFGER